MPYRTVKLKQNREAAVPSRHPWIYSGALEPSDQPIPSGEIVSVLDHDGQLIATGSYSSKSMIAVRIFQFSDVTVDGHFLKQRIVEADGRRHLLGFGPGTDTTAYRVVYGESDGLPGLAIDRYDNVFVIQISTAGMDRLRDDIVAALREAFDPAGIFERSDIPTRAHEGLEQVSQLLDGSIPDLVPFVEGGRKSLADVRHGQKTGFFLDQKDLRREIQRMAGGLSVVDLFCYSGGNGLAALLGGAASVVAVDASEPALNLVQQHVLLNGIDESRVTRENADVFQWLTSRREPAYDMVILDPPALIKSRRHAESGRKGYHFLNRAAIRLINHGGLLVTSSCSAFFTEEDFETTLRRASEQAGVELYVVKRVGQGSDHPVGLSFPEAAYLKSFICQVYRRPGAPPSVISPPDSGAQF